MKRTVRWMALIASSSALLSGLALTPAGAAAASGVSTGGATSITETSATVSGSISSSSGASAYDFAYGQTTSYGQTTTTEPAPTSGTQEVTATITGLSPGVTYHFELVAVVGSGSYSSHVTGGDETFTTATATSPGRSGSGPHGSLALLTSRLAAKSGRTSISLKCNGTHACQGTLSVTTKHKVGSKLKKVTCIKSASFSIGAGKTKKLKPAVSGSCAALLGKAKKHKLSAKLTASMSTGQPKLSHHVTVIRK